MAVGLRTGGLPRARTAIKKGPRLGEQDPSLLRSSQIACKYKGNGQIDSEGGRMGRDVAVYRLEARGWLRLQ